MENSGIKTVFGKITVDNVKEDAYKPALDSAQIRQEVTRIYPSVSTSNNLQDGLFSTEDFGLEGGSEYKEIRVTWLPVPKGTSAEAVQAMLDKCTGAKIYKILANEPILTSGQEYAIESGLSSLDVFENSQMVRDSEGDAIPDANGAVQFSAKFFSKDGSKGDEDRRETSIAKVEDKASLLKDDLASG